VKGNIKIWLLVLVASLFVFSCTKDPVKPEEEAGNISFKFEHRIDGKAIQFDTMKYVNAAGNHYLVNEIQYFISDIILHHSNGEKQVLDAWDDIIYIDTDLEETQFHAFPDEISPGSYHSITFTFGINEIKNQSLMFVNPPESFMFWPELLGGGYHYMKLNGKWLDTLNQVSPYNFHLGIGQVYHSFPDSITNFIQNYFEVELPESTFEITAGQTLDLTILMNVENWFQSPNVYNHDVWGGDIMQKQDAMKLACENGWNVFTLEK